MHIKLSSIIYMRRFLYDIYFINSLYDARKYNSIISMCQFPCHIYFILWVRQFCMKYKKLNKGELAVN